MKKAKKSKAAPAKKAAVKVAAKAPAKAAAKAPAKAASKGIVGEMIRKARESAGVSQEQLADKLHTKRTAISRIENHADDIKLSTLERISKALGKELKIKIG
jgi:ribosome-binding protein aMBF1 (putative translation factor)